LPKAKDARADKAFEMYKQGLKLIEIANQLGIAEGTVRSWKNRYKWDDDGNATLRKKEKKERNVAKKIATQTNDASWVEIEHEYVTDISRKPCSLEDLAKKYSIPIDTIKDRSAKDGWVRKRTEYAQQTLQKVKEKSSDADADRIARLLSIADKAAEKAEQALGELEQYVVRDKKKVKTVEYKDNTAIGKPTKEIIDETEHINIASGPVDRLGLSQVTGALKNLKEIYMIPATLEKQSAETALLKAKVQTDDEEETADDGFLEALQGSAAEDWMDEEN
jgi:phage terminase small subunit